jgi:hypothetical protein
MEAQERGFKVGSRFFPYVPLDDWFNRDFVVAREITKTSIEKLLTGEADALTAQQALLAVAVWHEDPNLQMDHIAKYVLMLKPAQVEEVGFDEPDLPVEGDAGPPDVATPDGSSSSSGPSSD